MRASTFLLIFVLGSASAGSGNPSLAHRFEDFRNLEESVFTRELNETQRASAIADGYEAMIAPDQTDADFPDISDPELRYLFQAAYIASFYVLDDMYVEHMTKDMREMERRGLATDADLFTMFKALVMVRDFSGAAELADRHPRVELPEVPSISTLGTVGHGPSELAVIGPNELLHRPVDPASLHILVIAHPLCHFTEDAADFIENDPTLEGIFRQHARWIAPQDGTTDLSSFMRWNEVHPDAQITLAYDRREWPSGIDVWATPAFYVVRDGRVLDRVVGWPAEGNGTELVKMLERHRLLPTDCLKPDVANPGRCQP